MPDKRPERILLVASPGGHLLQMLALEPAWQGSGYDALDRPHVPATLRDAAALLAGSSLARAAFGDQVVDHYLNAARVEQAQFDRAVTDWELLRYFERI